ncbi:uncharacterized protein OCT59_028549 [Rhizophagus irregularis]|uniref:uncharacterized protein n=1 Tax=Rhizophagus irregularis TaxID=588596 RepID=UPI003331A2BC|nr:hypothetical protein OCT59_028549 [Rhizophagus irregularis]
MNFGGRLLLAGHCTETPSWNWNFGLKISASGYWISASRVLWDIGFWLPGSLGYWISASRVLDIGSLRFLGQLLSFYSVHPTCNTIRGPRRDWIPISKVQDAHLETLTLTSGLRIWIQNFFLWIYLTMADFILT